MKGMHRSVILYLFLLLLAILIVVFFLSKLGGFDIIELFPI
ncbi:MAG: hypothetical protein ACE5J4_03055 [Candidatus Aenigmatarchaeota archaeon]